MIVGFDKLKIIEINPSKDKILRNFPEYFQEDFDYSYVNGDSHILDFYMENNKNEVFKHTIILNNNVENYKNILYVNQTADYQLVKDESQLFESFKTFQKGVNWNNITFRYEKYETLGPKLYCVSTKEEVELMQLLRCIEPHNIYSEKTNFFLNLEKLFKGDLSEIRNRFITTADWHVTALFYVEKGVQRIYKQFMPYNFYRDVKNNMAVSNVYKKLYKEFKYNLPPISPELFYILQKSSKFDPSMLPKKKILIHDEPTY